MVEPEEKTVLVYTLQNGQYMGLRPVILGQMVNSPLFPQLKIEVDEVFDRTDFFWNVFFHSNLYHFMRFKKPMFVALHIAQLVGDELGIANAELRGVGVVMPIPPTGYIGSFN